jgi:hypothetical protein
VFSIQTFDFAFLCLLLPLFLFLLGVLLDVGLKLRNPEKGLVHVWGKHEALLLFRSDNFPFYCLLIVWSSTSGTQSIHIILDVVIAELTDLWRISLVRRRVAKRSRMRLPGTRKGMAESFCLKDRTLRRKEDCALMLASAKERLRHSLEGSAERRIHTKSHRHRR